MPRNGSITISDLIGKLAVLRVACEKCGRMGQYRVDQLTTRLGPDAMLTNYLDELTADCPRKQSTGLADACGARYLDLTKLF
jgi:hypothetical protein